MRQSASHMQYLVLQPPPLPQEYETEPGLALSSPSAVAHGTVGPVTLAYGAEWGQNTGLLALLCALALRRRRRRRRRRRDYGYAAMGRIVLAMPPPVFLSRQHLRPEQRDNDGCVLRPPLHGRIAMDGHTLAALDPANLMGSTYILLYVYLVVCRIRSWLAGARLAQRSRLAREQQWSAGIGAGVADLRRSVGREGVHARCNPKNPAATTIRIIPVDTRLECHRHIVDLPTCYVHTQYIVQPLTATTPPSSTRQSLASRLHTCIETFLPAQGR